MKKILFLCTENACRSQMAEGIANVLLGPKVQAFSAGTKPAGINPLAVAVLKEKGIDITNASSKHINEFRNEPFDLVITLCGAANEACPFWPEQGQRIHFGLEDPARAKGNKDEVIAKFRAVRDKIINELMPLVASKLDLKVSF